MESTFSLENNEILSDDECSDFLRETFEFDLEHFEVFAQPKKKQRIMVDEEYESYIKECCTYLDCFINMEEECVHVYSDIVHKFCLNNNGNSPSHTDFKDEIFKIQEQITQELYNGETNLREDKSIDLTSYCTYEEFEKKIMKHRKAIFAEQNKDKDCKKKRKVKNTATAKRFRRIRDLYVKQLQEEIKYLHSFASTPANNMTC
tara:strand:- start:1787 stop:2398 length:612 start_codon:yes stop_codon:yes gene_type:complete